MDVGMALLMQTTTANTFVMLKFLKHFLMFLCNIYYQNSNRKLLVLLISQRPFICSLWVLFRYVTLWDDHLNSHLNSSSHIAVSANQTCSYEEATVGTKKSSHPCSNDGFILLFIHIVFE